MHTYYVLAGETPVLVHNSSCPAISMDEAGRKITQIARFEINLKSPHAQQYGPHLNLETQIDGQTVRSGPLADSHTPIDVSTMRNGDIP